MSGKDFTGDDCREAVRKAVSENPEIADPFFAWMAETFGTIRTGELNAPECAKVMDKIKGLRKSAR